MKRLGGLLVLVWLSLAGAQQVQGTLYASEVWGFALIACHYDPVLQDCDEELSAVEPVTATGTSAAYRFDGLAEGVYLIIAWKDLDGDGAFDLDGEDEVAFHADADGDPMLVALPARGVDIVSGSWATLMAGIGSTTLTGTLHADDVSGFMVIACAIQPSTQACDPDRVVAQEVEHGGTSAVFRLELPDAAEYLLIAWKDVNGNGELEEDGPDQLAYWLDAAGEIAYLSPPASDLSLRAGAGAAAVAVGPGTLVGTWSSFHGSAIDYVNPNTGLSMPASGSGVEFTFRADGSYERYGFMSNSFFASNTTIFVHEVGRYTFDGRNLQLRGSSDTTFRRNGEVYREENGVAVAWSYTFDFETADTIHFGETGSTLRRTQP